MAASNSHVAQLLQAARASQEACRVYKAKRPVWQRVRDAFSVPSGYGMSRSSDARRFNKFEWLKALRSDPVITGTSAFHVGVDLCTTFTRGDGTGWRFKLAELPAVGGKPLTRNTINAGIRMLVERGFVTVTYRAQGGRHVTAELSVDLKPVRSSVGVSTETSPADGAGLPDTPPPEWGSIRGYLHAPTPKPAQLNAKTSPIQRSEKGGDHCRYLPSGTSSGTSSGDASAREVTPTKADPPGDDPPEVNQPHPFVSAAPASAGPPNPSPGPEPPPRCESHAHIDGWNPVKCGPCGDADRKHARWAKAYNQWREGEQKEIRADIDRCNKCGPQGMTNDDIPVRCHRHRQMSDVVSPLPTNTRQEARR